MGALMDVSTILEGLSCGRSGCQCVRSARAGHGLSHCPAHPDEHPSLNVDESGDKLLWNCKAGCSQEAVLVKLQERGLWPSEERQNGHRKGRRGEPRLILGRKRWEIRDVVGQLVAVHERVNVPGDKEFKWWRPDGSWGLNGTQAKDLPLYGSELLSGKPEAPVLLVEGEKTADALRAAGVLALATVTGASACPDLGPLQVLVGRRVLLWPDHDEAGRRHMERVGRGLGQVALKQLQLVEWAEAPEKGDAADYLAQHSRVDLQELLRAAKPWDPATEPATGGRKAKGGLPESGWQLRIIRSDPKVFELVIAELGGPVELSGQQFTRWNSVEVECIVQLERKPSWFPRGPGAWPLEVTRLLEHAETVEASPELTHRGRVLRYLRAYCRGSQEHPRGVFHGRVWEDAARGFFLFGFDSFVDYLGRWHPRHNLKEPEITKAMKGLGIGRHRPHVWDEEKGRDRRPWLWQAPVALINGDDDGGPDDEN